MAMEYIAVFGVAFVAELCAAGYTISLARGNMRYAVACSLLIAVVSWGMVLFVIDNHALILPSIAGEVLGTTVMMRFTSRGK